MSIHHTLGSFGTAAKDVTGAMTAAEAIKAAGLDWSTRIERIVTTSGLPISGRRCRAVVREDNNTVIGVVGERHGIIDNMTCFDFMDSVAGKAGGVSYESAGYLGHGERIWLLARTEGIIKIGKKGRDQTLPFLLLHNAHDGTASLSVLFTAVRVSCENSLNAALRDGLGRGIKIRHSGDLSQKVMEAQRILGIARTCFDDLSARFVHLSKTKMSDAQRAAYFAKVFHGADSPDNESGDVDSRRWPATLETLETLAVSGKGQSEFPEIHGTAWAALNAVTEYIDHHSGSHAAGRSEDEKASTRVDQILFGAKARTKTRALDMAAAFAAN
jgi:phage/plasmid-like protein (TIGR03299 family)